MKREEVKRSKCEIKLKTPLSIMFLINQGAMQPPIKVREKDASIISLLLLNWKIYENTIKEVRKAITAT